MDITSLKINEKDGFSRNSSKRWIMKKKELLDWLKKCEKVYEDISNNLESTDYLKGVMDGAKIAILSVIKKIEED